MTAKGIRKIAWDALAPHWLKVIGLTLLAGFVSFAVQFVLEMFLALSDSFLGVILYIIVMIAMMPFSYSIFWISMRLLRTGEIVVDEIFEPYNSANLFLKVVGLSLVTAIFIFLWTLLLIVPGIIKSLSYSLVPFILKDKPELTILEAITLSRKMMDGNKLDLFWLHLTFIGWGILVLITFGLLALWVVPYKNTALAVFYEDIREDYERSTAI